MAEDIKVSVNVTVDPVKLAEFMRSPNGPVFRHLIEQGEKVKREAQRRVGVHRPVSGERRERRPGTLRDSIVKRTGYTASNGNPAVYVGSDDPIALIHHEGTQPHPITPVRAARLVFFWPKAGRVVYLKAVNHPGTQPNRYLTEALSVLV